MKITRNRVRGTALLDFSLSDNSLDEWLKEAGKDDVSLYDAAEKVLKRRGGKVKETSGIQDEEDEG